MCRKGVTEIWNKGKRIQSLILFHCFFEFWNEERETMNLVHCFSSIYCLLLGRKKNAICKESDKKNDSTVVDSHIYHKKQP